MVVWEEENVAAVPQPRLNAEIRGCTDVSNAQ